MLHRPSSLGPLAGALLLSLLPSSMARSADLDYGYGSAPPPIAESKVEFGSGWYVRGDLGATTLPAVHIAPPNPLPGDIDYEYNNPFTPAAPGMSIAAGSDVGFVASLAAGYQFNRYLRSDLMFDYHQPVTGNSVSGNGGVFCPTGISYTQSHPIVAPDGSIEQVTPTYATGDCTGHYAAHLNYYDVLINGYIDLGTWFRVTPYVGAGVGLSFGHYQTSATYTQANGVAYHPTYNDPLFGPTSPNYDRYAGGTFYNFAFAGMAGIAIDVYPHTKLDIGYRYLNLGHVANLNGMLYEHEARAGLRYMIDN